MNWPNQSINKCWASRKEKYLIRSRFTFLTRFPSVPQFQICINTPAEVTKSFISLIRRHLVFSTCSGGSSAGHLENTACDSPSKTNTLCPTSLLWASFYNPQIIQHKSVYVHTAAFTSRHNFNTRKMPFRPELIALNQPSWLEKTEEQIYVWVQRIAHRACRVRYTWYESRPLIQVLQTAERRPKSAHTKVPVTQPPH